MNCSKLPANKQESCVTVPADALDDLLEAIWHWAFEDYLATPVAERNSHIFNTIVRLDSDLHGIAVEESWVRIEAWRNQQDEGNPQL